MVDEDEGELTEAAAELCSRMCVIDSVWAPCGEAVTAEVEAADATSAMKLTTCDQRPQFLKETLHDKFAQRTTYVWVLVQMAKGLVVAPPSHSRSAQGEPTSLHPRYLPQASRHLYQA